MYRTCGLVSLIGLSLGCSELDQELIPTSMSPAGPVPTATAGHDSAGPLDTGAPPEPTGCALVFDDRGWSYHGTENPTLGPSGTPELILIPDERYRAGAAVVWDGTLQIPFTLSLEYMIVDDDGVVGFSSDNTADGLAIQFLKDASVYEDYAVPVGGSLGVIFNKTGYVLSLKTYGSRRIMLLNGKKRRLFSVQHPGVYTGRIWQPLILKVDSSGMDLVFDGQVHRFPGLPQAKYGGLIFSAATGASDGGHLIRNVCVTP